MKNLYYESDFFQSREEAWSHFEAHWAEANPAIARELDWEGMKAAYEAATYWEGRWRLFREVVDYTERKPTPAGAREVISTCPACGTSALVQKGDYVFQSFYVHVIGKQDDGKAVPIRQHAMPRARPGDLIDYSS